MEKKKAYQCRTKLNLNGKRNIKTLSFLKQSHRMKPTGTVVFEKTDQSETKKEGRNKTSKKVHIDQSFQNRYFQDKAKKNILF